MDFGNTNDMGKILDFISDIVFDKVTSIRKSNNLGNILIPAEVIFDIISEKFNCSEQLFIQCINNIKESNIGIYNKISLPKKWKLNAHIKYPEAYPTPDKILCIVKKSIKASDIYPEIKDRVWNENEKIWVPDSNPITVKYICDDIIEMIGAYHKDN